MCPGLFLLGVSVRYGLRTVTIGGNFVRLRLPFERQLIQRRDIASVEATQWSRSGSGGQQIRINSVILTLRSGRRRVISDVREGEDVLYLNLLDFVNETS